jgi:hypothetical protein
MVLIFSKVQRCNIKGAPNGFYGYKEEFDAPAELAKQLVDANVAGYVEKKPQAPEPSPAPEPEPQPTPEEEPAPEPSQKGGKKPRR